MGKWGGDAIARNGRDFSDSIRRWFDQAPAIQLLKVLTFHLLSVQPTAHHRPGNSVVVRPASFDFAIDLLTTKYLPEDNQSSTSVLQQAMCELATSSEDVSESLNAVVALPEIADLYASGCCLSSSAAVSKILNDALTVVESLQGEGGSSLMAEIVLRLSLRGYTKQVACALVETASSKMYTTLQSGLWQHIPKYVATTHLDRLLHAVVLKASETCQSEPNAPSNVLILKRLIPKNVWRCRSDVRFMLADKLLTQHVLLPAALSLLLDYLAAQEALGLALNKVASAWGDVSMIRRLSVPLQAHLTAALAQGIGVLGKDRFQSQQGLLPTVLKGITNRLESPLPVVQRQGMRVGNAMSVCLDSKSEPIFGSENVDLLPEEQGWTTPRNLEKSSEASSTSSKKTRQKALGVLQPNDEPSHDGPLTETDSDDELDDEAAAAQLSSDSEFEQYDLHSEGSESDDASDEDAKNLQLRDVIKMLRGGENEWRSQLRALKLVGRLVEARPDELSLSAVTLARALLHTQIPSWADEEWTGEGRAEEGRLTALVSLTIAVPEPVGVALAMEFYSPSVDLIQRSRCLAVLSTAAKDLSKSKLSSTSLSSIREGSGRDMLKNNPGLHNNTVNRFAYVAIPWTAALLKQCDVPGHGIDLFGKDTFLLGRLLITLGSFLEAAQHCAEAVPLAAAVIELLKANNVHDSEEPYVRRAALVVATQVLMAVPHLLVGPTTFMVPHDNGGEFSRSIDWLNRWITSVAQSDVDGHCREMATVSVNLFSAVTAESMASRLADKEAGVGVLPSEFKSLQLPTSISIEQQQLRMPGVAKIRIG
jgi:hypothetical protein